MEYSRAIRPYAPLTWLRRNARTRTFAKLVPVTIQAKRRAYADNFRGPGKRARDRTGAARSTTLGESAGKMPTVLTYFAHYALARTRQAAGCHCTGPIGRALACACPRAVAGS